MSDVFAATLTPEKVRDRVTEIASASLDFEAAHSMEDELHREVLTAIAVSRLTGVDAIRAALYAITTKDIDFPRHCA